MRSTKYPPQHGLKSNIGKQLLLMAFVLLLSACGGGSTDTVLLPQDADNLSFTTTAVSALTTDGRFTRLATSNGGVGDLSYASSDTFIATVNNGVVTINSAGVVTITAELAGNDIFSPLSKSYILTINKVDQAAVINTTSAVVTFNDADITPSVSGGSGSSNTVIATISSNENVASIQSNGDINIGNAGTTTITLQKVGDDIYNPATISFTLTVNKADQTISYTGSATAAIDDATLTAAALSDNASATGAVSFMSSSDTSVASVTTNGQINIGNIGTTTVVIQKAADVNFNAATLSFTLTVNKADQTLINSGSNIATVGDSNLIASATSDKTSATGNVSFISSSDTSVAKIANNGMLIVGNAGSTTIVIEKAADANYNAATLSFTLSINKSDQVLSYTGSTSVTVDSAALIASAVSDKTNATGNVSFISSNDTSVASIDVSGQIIVGNAGTTNVVLEKAADANYNAATSSVELTVTNVLRAPTSFSAAPTGELAASGNGDEVRLQWAAVNGASAYTIYYSKQDMSARVNSAVSTLGSVAGLVSANVTAPSTTFTTPPLDGNKYYFLITATVDGVQSLTSQTQGEAIPFATVNSADTDKVWMSRNLGAIQDCSASTDTQCYGNLYEWGRASDGHQRIDRDDVRSRNCFNAAGTSVDCSAAELVTTTLANTITAITNPVRFIIPAGDWVSSGIDDNGALRTAAWTDGGVNDICPVGFSVPTNNELFAETVLATTPVTNGATAYNSFLKIPPSGIRNFSSSGNLGTGGVGSIGMLWSRTADINNAAHNIIFSGTTKVDISLFAADRTLGGGIRCILSNAINQNITNTGAISAVVGDAPLTPQASSNRGSSASGAVTAIQSSDTTVASISASGQIVVGNTGTTTITIKKAADANYTAAVSSFTFTVSQGTSQTITNSGATSAAFGGNPLTPLATSDQGTAATGAITAIQSSDTNVASISASGQIVIVNVGVSTITIQKAADSIYNTATTTFSLTVTAATQTISNIGLSTAIVGDAALTPQATSNQSAANGAVLAILSSNTGVASIAGDGSIVIVGSGITTITLEKAADASYASATTDFVLTVSQGATQTISNTGAISATFGDSPLTAQASSNQGTATGAVRAIQSSNVNIASISSSGQILIGNAGTTTITLQKALDPSFDAATTTFTLTVGRANQIIRNTLFTNNVSLGDLNIIPSASSNKSDASGAVTAISSSDNSVAAITAGGRIDILDKIGTTTITLQKAQDNNYNAATTTFVLFVKGPQTISNSGVTRITFGDSAPIAKATSNRTDATGRVRFFSSSNRGVAIIEVRSNLMTIRAAGTTVIRLLKEGDNQYNTAFASFTLVVDKASQTITSTFPTSRVTVGDIVVPRVVSNRADATGDLIVTSVTAEAFITPNGNVSFLQPGRATIQLLKFGDRNYNQATTSFVVTAVPPAPRFLFRGTRPSGGLVGNGNGDKVDAQVSVVDGGTRYRLYYSTHDMSESVSMDPANLAGLYPDLRFLEIPVSVSGKVKFTTPSLDGRRYYFLTTALRTFNFAESDTSVMQETAVPFSTVKSPATGRFWMSRNLGASQDCTSATDPQCYGDLYQWNRGNAGGYEFIDRSGLDKCFMPFLINNLNFDLIGLTKRGTSVNCNDRNVTSSVLIDYRFFIGKSDWYAGAGSDGSGSIRLAEGFWSVGGTGAEYLDICPPGFEVPSSLELALDTVIYNDSVGANIWDNPLSPDGVASTSADAFASFLKLPNAGRRQFSNGSLADVDTASFIWTNSPDDPQSVALAIDPSARFVSAGQSNGYSVRCIKKIVP